MNNDIDASSSVTCEFGPITVNFDDRVLTPRPWTLMQSSWAADLAADRAAGPLLELCAGAGHIGLAAAVLADRDLVQIEVDAVAADYARDNAAKAGFGDRVDVRNALLESALSVDEYFSVVIADPPYLPSATVSRWPKDPVRAIDGGIDGLDLVRACLQVGVQHLTEDGVLLLQVAGTAQAAVVIAWVEAATTLGLRHEETRSHDPDRAITLFCRNR